MIVQGDIVRIQYLDNNFIQTKKILSQEEELSIEANKVVWNEIQDFKEKAKFEKKNKCFSERGEIWKDSPFGKAILGKNTGDEVIVVMNSTIQPNFKIKIL